MTGLEADGRLCTDIVKTAAEGLSYGMIYVGEDGNIGEYSPLAKEMMGVTLPAGESHPEGELERGDIVIFLDNDLGNDDCMTPEDLKTLNKYRVIVLSATLDENIHVKFVERSSRAAWSSPLEYTKTKKFSRYTKLSASLSPTAKLSCLSVIWDLALKLQ